MKFHQLGDIPDDVIEIGKMGIVYSSCFLLAGTSFTVYPKNLNISCLVFSVGVTLLNEVSLSR